MRYVFPHPPEDLFKQTVAVLSSSKSLWLVAIPSSLGTSREEGGYSNISSMVVGPLFKVEILIDNS